ncbi:MAG: hypothetical protein RIR47_1015 [Bacteroidota bacterium]|jgi:nucleoid-associated protein YgaU
MSRLNSRKKSLTNNFYTEYLRERGLSEVMHIPFTRLKKLSDNEKRLITQVSHTWKSGDRYYKLAFHHYGNPSYWWIIALFNNKPTEASISIGDTIIIPKPLSLLITLYSE